ncbi:MAG: PilZ domain-containing protein [Pseudomonadota bacterium]
MARIVIADKVGRRSAPRLRLSIPAKLISLFASDSCILTNLSRGGARVVLDDPLPVGDEVFLRFHQTEQFAWVIHSDASGNGLEFEAPLDDELILAMRKYDEGFETIERFSWREAVKDWVNGGGLKY